MSIGMASISIKVKHLTPNKKRSIGEICGIFRIFSANDWKEWGNFRTNVNKTKFSCERKMILINSLSFRVLL
jgi:hypothetical protein